MNLSPDQVGARHSSQCFVEEPDSQVPDCSSVTETGGKTLGHADERYTSDCGGSQLGSSADSVVTPWRKTKLIQTSRKRQFLIYRAHQSFWSRLPMLRLHRLAQPCPPLPEQTSIYR